MDERLYLAYSKDPARLQRELTLRTKTSCIILHEIQRVPALLNVIQALLDEGCPHRNARGPKETASSSLTEAFAMHS